MKNYDVIVVGGGFAGVGAAVASARLGAKTLLIEKSGCLGGAASNSLVLPFMRYFTDVKDDDGTKKKLYLVQGIFKEIVERAKSREVGADTFFNTDYLKYILDNMLCESGADVLFHATLSGAEVEDGKIKSIEVSTVNGKNKFGADCFVDATGDANLAMLSKCGFRLGRESDSLCQPMTLCFRVTGVSFNEFFGHYSEIQELYKEYRLAGKIKNPREDILVFKTCNENIIHFNSTRIVKLNPTDPFDLSRAEIEGRKQMIELTEFLKNNFEFCRNISIVSSAVSVGVRESRMINGEHILTGDELVKTTKFADAIAAGDYDIDIHNPEGTGTSHHYFEAGTYYTIPYRSLVAKDVSNLLVAGRCISCDHEAQASIRIMPICCATGHAAGVAAAIASNTKKPAKSADVKLIQKELKNQNAFIGLD